jgi:hypothetical protein
MGFPAGLIEILQSDGSLPRLAAVHKGDGLAVESLLGRDE